MNLETLLDALSLTAYTQDTYFQGWIKRFPEGSPYHRRTRQFFAFRARILARDAEIGRLTERLEWANGLIAQLMEMKDEKDATIERLRRNNQTFANDAVLDSGSPMYKRYMSEVTNDDPNSS